MPLILSLDPADVPEDGEALLYEASSKKWRPMPGTAPDLPASKITSGVLSPARLGTGAANDTKVLFGDGTWKPAPTAGSASDPIEMVKLSDYCSGDGSGEAGTFQDAVDDCLSTGATLLCDVRDPIFLESGVTLGDTRANSQQRIILTLLGALKLKALSAMDRLVTIRGTISTQSCHMELDSSAGLAKFTIYAVNCGRMKLGHLHLFGGATSNFFIEPTGNNNLWSATTIRSTGGGSKLVTNATLTARSAESGWTSTGDSAPYSTWTLSNPLPAALSVNEWAAPLVKFADGRFMQVRRVVDSTHIEVFNEDRPLSTAESITTYGSSLNWAYYGDTGGWEVGQIDVRDNPNAAALVYGGYGGAVTSYYQQNNAVGLAILKKAHGLSVGQFYTELSGTWLICRDVLNTALFIGPGTNGAPTDYQIMQQGWMTMTGRNKQPLHWVMFKPSGSPIAVPPAVPVDVPELTPGTRNVTPGTVQAYRRTSGNYTLRIDNNYGSAVGLVVLAAPDTGAGTGVVFSLLNTGLGHTVMGGGTYTAKTFGPGTMFAFWLESGQADWKVSPVGIPNDSAAAITSAPARVGQLATVAGVGYMATGTSSTADWKQITN